MIISLSRAIEILAEGGLVAVPTETVYGLAADATNRSAIEALYRLKGRPSNHPVILHVASRSMLKPFCKDLNPLEVKLAEAFWPGPLTLVVKGSEGLDPRITGGRETVAVRAPAHPFTQALIVGLGQPIVAPSANRFGRVSPTEPAHVEGEFGADFPVLDGGECSIGLESTIVEVEPSQVTILRPGRISRADLQLVCDRPVVYPLHEEELPVPGGLKSHYAPSLPVAVVSLSALTWEVDSNTALLSLGTPVEGTESAAQILVLSTDPAEYGQQLYAALRKAEASGAEKIVVQEPPAEEAWQAVRDRLKRAAAPRER